jgi:hypothetical protein
MRARKTHKDSDLHCADTQRSDGLGPRVGVAAAGRPAAHEQAAGAGMGWAWGGAVAAEAAGTRAPPARLPGAQLSADCVVGAGDLEGPRPGHTQRQPHCRRPQVWPCTCARVCVCMCSPRLARQCEHGTCPAARRPPLPHHDRRPDPHRRRVCLQAPRTRCAHRPPRHPRARPSVRVPAPRARAATDCTGAGRACVCVYSDGGKQLILTKGDNNHVDDRSLYNPGQIWIHRDDIVGRAKAYAHTERQKERHRDTETWTERERESDDAEYGCGGGLGPGSCHTRAC